MNNINVVYTPWANLKKTADMDVGQIGFHRQKEVWGEINSDFAQTAANSGPDLLFACMSLFLFNWNYRKQTSLSPLCQKNSIYCLSEQSQCDLKYLLLHIEIF